MAEVHTASGLKTVTPMVRLASGLKECVFAIRTASGLVESGGTKPLTVTSSQDYVFGTGSSAYVQTPSVIISVAGGKAPYTFAWTLIEAISSGWTIGSPSGSTTTFTAGPLALESTADAIFECVVTDANGKTGSVQVSASATRYGGSDAPI